MNSLESLDKEANEWRSSYETHRNNLMPRHEGRAWALLSSRLHESICNAQPWNKGSFLLSVYAVVLMDFWPDVTDKGQEVIQDLIPVLLEVGLQDGHLLLGLLLYFAAATAVGSQRRSFLGLELLLPLQAVLFNFSLCFFFGLLQPPVLSCFQNRELIRK